MNKLERIISAVLIALVLFVIGVQLGIRHGRELGYSDGWRDAHCGVGQSCESGDE